MSGFKTITWSRRSQLQSASHTNQDREPGQGWGLTEGPVSPPSGAGLGGRGVGCSGLAQPRFWRQHTLWSHTTSPLSSEHKAIHTASAAAHRDNQSRQHTSTRVMKATQVSIDFQSDSNYTLKNIKKCLGIRITANTNFAKIF